MLFDVCLVCFDAFLMCFDAICCCLTHFDAFVCCLTSLIAGRLVLAVAYIHILSQVPIEKIFSKSLRDKFPWAMDVPGDFQFSKKEEKKKSDEKKSDEKKKPDEKKKLEEKKK
jgi:hypothetical protein